MDPSRPWHVTIVLDDVRDQALPFAGQQQPGLHSSGNVLRIATLETMKIDAEAPQSATGRQGACRAQETITRYLSYAMQGRGHYHQKFLSIRGRCCGRRTQQALIVEDIPDLCPSGRVDPLLVADPEVEIEARVVSVHPDVRRDIALNWVLVLPRNSFFFGNPGNGNSPIITSQPLPATTSTASDNHDRPE